MSYFLRLPVFLCLLLSSAALVAQTDFRPGYVIMNSGDTVAGLLDYRGDVRNSKVCTFKADKSAATSEFSPFDITGYWFTGSKVYEAKEITREDGKEKLFLEVIEKGRVNLFFYKDALENLHYFLNKFDVELYELVIKEFLVNKDSKTYLATINRYKGILALLMGDNEKILQKYYKTALDHKSLANVVRDYNIYYKNQGATFSRNLPLFRVRGGLAGGMQLSTIVFQSEYSAFSHLTRSGFAKSMSPTFGVFVNTTIPKVNEKLSICSELLFQTNHYITYSEYQTVGRISREDVNLKIQYLRMPVMVRYTYPKGPVRPYVNAGVVFAAGRFVQNQFMSESETRSNGTVEFTETEAVLIRRTQESMVAGIGFTTKMTGRQWLFGEFRFEKGNGIINPDISKKILSKTTAQSFLLGISF